jgi:4-carboxymuconolactone decarboxylase
MRYPALAKEEMTQRQIEVADAMSRRTGQPLSGHLAALLYAPEVAEKVQLLGEFLRCSLKLPERLRILAFLVSAGRHQHADLADFLPLDAVQQSGLSGATLAALSEGRRPDGLKEDEQLVYDYSYQVIHTGRVKSATFDLAMARFGREVCLELVEVCGFTAFLTTILHVTQSRVSAGEV